MRKLVYYVATSLDGYIAGPQGEFDFFPQSPELLEWINDHYPESVPTHVRPLVGVPAGAPNRAWDTVIMGRGAYEPGLALGITSPYGHLRQYVCSRTLDPAGHPGVTIVPTDPAELVRQLKSEPGRDIWLCGGGMLAGGLAGEIDRLIIKTYPVLVGAGIRALAGTFAPARFDVTGREEFAGGAQVTWYDRAH